MDARSWGMFIISVAVILDNMLFGMIAPIIPLYVKELGASSGELGLLMASYSVTILIFAIPTGMMSDRIGRKPIILLGLLGGGLSSILFAVSENLSLLLVSRIIQGFSTSLIFSSCFAYIADISPPNQRGGKMGLLGGLMGVGLITGPVFGGILADMGGKSLPGAVFFLSLIPSPVYLVETRSKARRKEPLALKSILSNFNILSILFIITLVTIPWGSLEVVFPLHVSDKFGGGITYLGTIFGVGAALFCGFRYVSGMISDRMGRRHLILLGIFTLSLGSFMLSLAGSLWSVGLILCLVFFAYGLFFGVAIPYITDMISYTKILGEPHGTASALYNISWSASFFLGPWLGGSLYEHIGFDTLHLIYSAGILICLIWAHLFCPEPGTATTSERA
ncbi:MAG: MFS transporter [Deltaproteobacteria bacterium]|nr:MFS transporter [Deltaproteobacteria bacterium]